MTGGSSLNYACLEIVKNFSRCTFLLAILFTQLKDAQEVRLVNGGGSWLGRVEIYYNGQWGTVCDDDWTIIDAQVVCRQLGFADAVIPYPEATFGGGTLPILLDNTDCIGVESRIQDCDGKWGENSHDCGHSEDAGVECQIDEAYRDETSVRLVSGGKPWRGRVEVYYNGRWGAVCDDDWTIEDAKVVCRQLDFDGALAAYTRDTFGASLTLPILFDDAGCTGYESRIRDCYGNWGGWNDCRHWDHAGVECQADEDETDVWFIVIRTAIGVCFSIVAGVSLYKLYKTWCQNNQQRNTHWRITLRNTEPAAPVQNLNTSTVVENISVPAAPPAYAAASVPLSTAWPPPDGNVSMTVPSPAAQDLPPSYDVVMEDLETFAPPPGKIHTDGNRT